MLRAVPLLLLGVLAPDVSEPVTQPVSEPATEMSAEVSDDACEPPEPGFLTLDTRPWTVVYVDGSYAGSTPLFRHKLPPGDHTLTLVNEGRDVMVEEAITVDEGKTRKVRLLLIADEAGTAFDDSAAIEVKPEDCFIPVDETAYFSVDTRPWSQVWLDGRRVGSTPLFELPIVQGDHIVRMVRDDGKTAFTRFTAAAGETVRLSIDLKE